MTADRRIYFISDLHLGDGSRSDAFLGKDRELIALLQHVRNEGAQLVIAGDFIDLHQAISISRVLKAHARLMGELSRHAETHGVTYIWGNHDYDISLFRDLLRFDVCSTLHVGDRILVQHGYQFDPYIGPHLEGSHMMTMGHHLVERLLGSWIRLPLDDFYTLPNRATFWVFHKFSWLVSTLSRMAAAQGHPEWFADLRMFVRYWALNQIGDPGLMYEGVKDWMPSSPYRFLVAGHSHMPGRVEIGPERTYINTGSWTFSSAQYALWDGQDFSVRDWVSGRLYGDGAYRPLIDGHLAHMGLEEWWRENYMGWLRYRVGEEGRLRWTPPPVRVAPLAGPGGGATPRD